MAKESPAAEQRLINSLGIKHGTNINAIKVPKELEQRVDTGIGFLNDLFGAGDQEQGLTPSTSVLFTGTPGAGKTTLALQLADSMMGRDCVCLYNTNEESALQVRKVTKRLGLKYGFYVGEDRLVSDVLKHADMLRAQNPGKPFLLVCDSIQTHDDGFYNNGATNSMTPVRVTKMVTSYCKENFSMAVLIGQVNKNGLFSGKQQIKHDVDVHAHLLIDQKPQSESFGKRILKIEKNRFGFSQTGYFLGLDSKKGLYEEGTWSPTVTED